MTQVLVLVVYLSIVTILVRPDSPVADAISAVSDAMSNSIALAVAGEV